MNKKSTFFVAALVFIGLVVYFTQFQQQFYSWSEDFEVKGKNPYDIKVLFSTLISAYPEIEFGAHLHTDLNGWYAKVDAAYAAGCLRFDSAIMGHGGCPMANDSLVGNLPTERLISYLNKRKVPMQLNTFHFESAYNFSKKIFL